MIIKLFGRNGVIGGSGKWYSCHHGQHLVTCGMHPDDAPFVWCSCYREVFCEVDPNRKQFETFMLWCTENNLKFEDVAIGAGWEGWLTT